MSANRRSRPSTPSEREEPPAKKSTKTALLDQAKSKACLSPSPVKSEPTENIVVVNPVPAERKKATPAKKSPEPAPSKSTPAKDSKASAAATASASPPSKATTSKPAGKFPVPATSAPPRPSVVSTPTKADPKKQPAAPRPATPAKPAAAANAGEEPPMLGPIAIPANLDFAAFKEQCLMMMDLASAIEQLIGIKRADVEPEQPPAPMRGNAGAMRGRGGMRGAMPNRGGANRRPAGGNFGGRGGVGRAPIVRPINPIVTGSEVVTASPIGSKIGQPYLGPMPETISSQFFTMKNGAQKLPILFVLAPNTENPMADSAFDFDLLARIITQAGGHLVPSCDVLPLQRPNFPCATNLSFTVATSPNLSPEFLFGVAQGTRCIYPSWILECAVAGRLLDSTDYVLPVGYDLFGNALPQLRRRNIFGMRKLIVTGASFVSATRYCKVLFAAGALATPVDGFAEDIDDVRAKVADAAFVIVLPDLPPMANGAILHLAKELKKPLVTLDWMAQSLMFGRVVEHGCNAAFTWKMAGDVEAEMPVEPQPHPPAASSAAAPPSSSQAFEDDDGDENASPQLTVRGIPVIRETI